MKPSLKIAFVLAVALAVAFLIVGPLSRRTARNPPSDPNANLSGRWVWRDSVRPDEPQTRFTLVVDRTGDVLRGIYSVDVFINDEWQGEDGNQTPFLGRVEVIGARLEFDPTAVLRGYEENVSYRAPEDGQTPSVATLTPEGEVLVWRVVSGAPIDGVPSVLPLIRDDQIGEEPDDPSAAELGARYTACAVARGFDPGQVQVLIWDSEYPVPESAVAPEAGRPWWVKTERDVPASVHRPCFNSIGGAA